MNKKVIFSSLKMAIATFSSRILGLVREQVMAAMFGASGLTDAFTVAYRVPNMLRDLFAEGAFSAAFVPVFTENKLKGEKEARILLWSLFVMLLVVTGTISTLIILNSESIVSFMTDEVFRENIERFEITSNLVKIMAPFLVLVSLASLLMGALNSLKVFFIPSFAPALFNIVMIISMLFVAPVLTSKGINAIYSLGWGVLVGGFFQFLIQVPLVFKKNFGPLGPLVFFSKSTKKIVNRVGIGTIGIAATQINILITTLLATGTVVGAVSWLTYAFRLFQFPVGILSVSISGSNLVHFSDAWKNEKKEEAISILKSSYFLSFLTIIPAFALLMSMRELSVKLIFERGLFTEKDTLMTADALKFYLLGLPFYGVYKLFTPTFFSIDRPKVPVVISTFSIAVNLIFCLYFTPKYGFLTLAFGTSLSMIIIVLSQSIFLSKILGLNFSFFFNLRLLKVLASGVACFFISSYLAKILFYQDYDFLNFIVRFVITGLAGVATYIISLFTLGELKSLLKAVNK